MLCVRVTPSLRRRLKLVAASSGHPMQALAAEALETACRQLDMEACIQVAARRRTRWR
jgi:hypothetical protein